MNKIRIAHVSGLKTKREEMKKALLKEEAFEIVCSQQSIGRNFSTLRKSRPDVVIIDPETPNNFFDELDSRFIKLKRRIPEAKIILRTGRRGHHFVEDAASHGVNIIDDSIEIVELRAGIIRIYAGEHLEIYANRGQGLEGFGKTSKERE